MTAKWFINEVGSLYEATFQNITSLMNTKYHISHEHKIVVNFVWFHVSCFQITRYLCTVSVHTGEKGKQILLLFIFYLILGRSPKLAHMCVCVYVCTMYVCMFFIVACSITGSNSTCLNVIFTITEFRNNYINCCTLWSLLSLLGMVDLTLR